MVLSQKRIIILLILLIVATPYLQNSISFIGLFCHSTANEPTRCTVLENDFNTQWIVLENKFYTVSSARERVLHAVDSARA